MTVDPCCELTRNDSRRLNTTSCNASKRHIFSRRKSHTLPFLRTFRNNSLLCHKRATYKQQNQLALSHLPCSYRTSVPDPLHIAKARCVSHQFTPYNGFIFPIQRQTCNDDLSAGPLDCLQHRLHFSLYADSTIKHSFRLYILVNIRSLRRQQTRQHVQQHTRPSNEIEIQRGLLHAE